MYILNAQNICVKHCLAQCNKDLLFKSHVLITVALMNKCLQAKVITIKFYAIALSVHGQHNYIINYDILN